VIVAVAVVGVVEVAVDEVAGVVAVGDGFVAAAGAVDVVGVVTRASMAAGAGIRVGLGDFDDVFIDVIAVGVMEMTIMKVVGVVAMLDGGVAAVGAVGVVMVFVNIAGHD